VKRIFRELEVQRKKLLSMGGDCQYLIGSCTAVFIVLE
jgi:hypothetical protein